MEIWVLPCGPKSNNHDRYSNFRDLGIIALCTRISLEKLNISLKEIPIETQNVGLL